MKSAANIGKKLKDTEQCESQEESSKQTNVIIGIDYGTSFSGVAYTLYKRRPREPSVAIVSDWPYAHAHHRSSQKVPSDIAYDADGHVHCGFDIPEDCQRLKWVKLLLETDPDPRKAILLQAEEVINTRNSLAALGKTPVEAVSDYLRWLWNTVCETIADEQNDPELLATSNVTVMMTVPAMWSDAAKENTFQAAEIAGINADGRTVKFITEPEAAAIAELQLRISNGQIGKSDCVIICDAGGGTVDLVSYQVRNVEPMELDQAAVADGGLCGSSYIDAAFLNQVRSMMQSDWDKLSRATKDDIKERFAYTIKPSFDGKVNRKETIQLYSETGKFDHIPNGKLVIEPQIVRVTFETVLPRILALIDEQEAVLEEKGLRNKLKGVLLVGGLGSSRFVHSRIEQNFARDEGIKVWRGRHSWSSVVEGAVKCAFMSLGNIHSVTLRLSKYNYGIPFHPPFDPTVHRLEDKFMCPYEGTPKARLVQWLVRKGHEVKPNDAPQVYDFTKIVRSVDMEKGNCSTGFSLLQSSEDRAPEHITDAVKDYVKVECYFNQEILRGSWHRLYEQPDQPGRTFWKVVVQLQVHMLPAQVLFQCLLSGQNMVSTKVSYRSNQAPQTLAIDQQPPPPKQAQDSAVDRQYSIRSEAGTQRARGALMSSEPVDLRSPESSTTSFATYNSLATTHSNSAIPRPNSISSSSQSYTETSSLIASPRSAPSQRSEKEKKKFFWQKEIKLLGEGSPSIAELPGAAPGYYGPNASLSVRSKDSRRSRFGL